MLKFRLEGLRFEAENCIDGVPINPKLPPRFDCFPNGDRPATHRKWWYRPFIVTCSEEQMWGHLDGERREEYRRKWFESWPSGIRYDVRCLDGGAWDRSTGWGMFPTLEQALQCAQAGPSWLERRA